VVPDEKSWDELATSNHNDVKGGSVTSPAGGATVRGVPNTPPQEKTATTPPTSAAPRPGAPQNVPDTAEGVSSTLPSDPFKNRETRPTAPASAWLHGRPNDSVAPPQRPATSQVVNAENMENGPMSGRPRDGTNG
jgi:hypothetical protein